MDAISNVFRLPRDREADMDTYMGIRSSKEMEREREMERSKRVRVRVGDPRKSILTREAR